MLHDAEQRGFDPNAPVAVVASAGRYRVFLGHTDFLGLGGVSVFVCARLTHVCCQPTINCATRSEIFAVAQVAGDAPDQLLLSNSDERFDDQIVRAPAAHRC